MICKIDVRAMQEMRSVLTEILAIAQVHKLIGVHDEYGIIALNDAFHLLRSISQSRAVRYVRDPQAYLDHLHDTYKLSQSQPEAEAAPAADAGTAPSEETKVAS